MRLFHFKEQISDNNIRNWIVIEGALLWMRNVVDNPNRTQVCVKGNVDGSESTTFFVDMALNDIVDQKF